MLAAPPNAIPRRPRRGETHADHRARTASCTLLIAALLAGCAAANAPAPATGQAARAAECQEKGGWWHTGVGDGFCEYQMQGGGSM